MPPVILFCGGGSAGHTAPSVAVAQALRKKLPESTLHFVCGTKADADFLRHEGEEATVIRAAKFPRGFSLRWVTFPIIFPFSLLAALRIIRARKPSLIFSKGGYVSVPLCLAGYMLRVPIVLHESDSVQGLGNGLISRIARRICTGFPVGNPDARHVHTGNPVRAAIAHGSCAEGRAVTGFTDEKPVILVMGGSQGAQALNEAVIAQAEDLLALGNIIHLTGEGKSGIPHATQGYWSATFVQDALPHLYALADVVVSRAGAGSLSELAAAGKPVIAIPLRGLAQDHQYHNARVLAEARAVVLLEQGQIMQLTEALRALLSSEEERRAMGDRLRASFPQDAAERIADVLIGQI